MSFWLRNESAFHFIDTATLASQRLGVLKDREVYGEGDPISSQLVERQIVSRPLK